MSEPDDDFDDDFADDETVDDDFETVQEIFSSGSRSKMQLIEERNERRQLERLLNSDLYLD